VRGGGESSCQRDIDSSIPAELGGKRGCGAREQGGGMVDARG